MRSIFYHTHAWIGTQHCLREKLEDGDYQCVNDHTGCMYNDGHNTCVFETPSIKGFDSPLIKKYENRNSP
jgi:hypothetical protein